MNETDIQKTSVSINNGKYEFLKMPFVLAHALIIFQRAMDDGFLEILHFLEERPIFPRLPFMIIKSIGHERQSAVKEVFINVPICDDPPTSFQ